MKYSGWLNPLALSRKACVRLLPDVSQPADSGLPSLCLPSSVKENCETETRTCPALLVLPCCDEASSSCLRRGTTDESSSLFSIGSIDWEKSNNGERWAACGCSPLLLFIAVWVRQSWREGGQTVLVKSNLSSLGYGWDFQKHPQPWWSLGTQSNTG